MWNDMAELAYAELVWAQTWETANFAVVDFKDLLPVIHKDEPVKWLKND